MDPVPAGGRVIPFVVKRPCDPIALMPYRVVARDPDSGALDDTFVSLEGAEPGTPLHGTVTAGPQSDALLPVRVFFPGGFDAAAIRELVLEADTDGDGTYESLASTFVMPEPAAGAVTGVPVEGQPPRGALLTSPNPFVGGTSLAFTLAEPEAVTLEVYDFSGRLVRSLARGWLPAGPRRVTWDGRDGGGHRTAPGIYFARLRTRSGVHESRLVKLQ
jgi:flagellar hook capping protein FlgD